MDTQARHAGWRFGSALRFGALAGAITLVGMIGSAQATFHLIKIVEIFPGTAASPNAQYIVLQMHANGENLVSNHSFTYYDAAGRAIGSFTFQSNVANGANQSKILIATPEARTFFNVQPDFTTTPQLMRAGGKICYADTIDCVAWGRYTGSPDGVGAPFNAAGGGLVSGRAAIRRLDIFAGSGGDGYGGGVPGSTTTLEAQDDTNNCANDFRFGTPAPRNNAGQVGTVPAATCGNGRVEGLEQCDDGNTSNGDTCNSTCAVATYYPFADFNADGRSDLAWRNGQSGANMIWRSAISSQPQTIGTVSNTAWRMVGIGDFDRDGRSDLLWRNVSNGTNTIWRSASNTLVQAVASVGPAWTAAAVADFNGDGRADIVWRNNTTGANVLWRSANSATSGALIAMSSAWRIVGAGDFNRDGRADLLWRSSSGTNIIWRSAASTLPTNVTAMNAAWSVAGVGDFNGDGRDDILWRNQGTGSNVVWYSAVSSAAAMLSSAGTSWRAVAVADYNGDRRDDILWRNATTGGNVLWSSGNGATATPLKAVSAAWSVVP